MTMCVLGGGRRGSRAAAVLWCGVLAATSVACAEPGPLVSGTVLASGASRAPIRLEAPGSADVVVRRIVIQPGGSTGWHYHSGELIAVVQTGTLTREFADCSRETSVQGQSFVEPAGQNHVHIGRNLGGEPVELYVTYVIPPGQPLSHDIAGPSC